MTGPIVRSALDQTVGHFEQAIAAKKCWSCGCLRASVSAAEAAFGVASPPPSLAGVLEVARHRLVEARYDCLGCDECYPAQALNALSHVPGAEITTVDVCPAEPIVPRAGWPPLAGDYTVLQYRAPVAVCTLTDAALAAAIAAAIASDASAPIALVGTLQTENLGVERLVANVIANPSVRFLILAGADSRGIVGHLPGRSLLALARDGVDERGAIIGAPGKRPVLKNIDREAIEHFRRTVEVVDLIGQDDARRIMQAAMSCAERDPGPAPAFTALRGIDPLAGYVPERMVTDPAGYFVVHVDRGRRLLLLEHYTNDGWLDALVEGRSAAEVYTPAIDRELISRLDHAAYLGRELARAEHALASGTRYVQDGAAERLTGS
jgi:tetrahydromethanopterin S-methyltransferase subunit A